MIRVCLGDDFLEEEIEDEIVGWQLYEIHQRAMQEALREVPHDLEVTKSIMLYKVSSHENAYEGIVTRVVTVDSVTMRFDNGKSRNIVFADPLCLDVTVS